MESVYFALGVTAAMLVIHWALVADRRRAGAHSGLLAMRGSGKSPEAAGTKDARTFRRRGK
jgi:hypothetical protein